MQQNRLLALLLIPLLLSAPPSANACIWDRDTLAMEQARFPEVNELIVGYFPRHSEHYYRWRLEQVLAIPENQRTPEDYDDLGASYDKLGQHDKAIDTMLAKVERYPRKGLYETHANLGTFYIHNGDLEQGVQYIGSAIQINPDAHFGRELYQKLLVQYVLQQRAAGNTLPLAANHAGPLGSTHDGFADFVLANQSLDGGEKRMEEIERATKGILGMMRFGNYDSPVLLEALGDLLVFRFGRDAPQRLASRAYLKASLEVSDPEAQQIYRDKAEAALDSQQGESLAGIEGELKKEIARGDAYFAKIQADEKAWVEAGKDLDVAFQKAYYPSPTMSQSLAGQAVDRVRGFGAQEWAGVVLVGTLALYLLVGLIRMRRRRRLAEVEAVAADSGAV